MDVVILLEKIVRCSKGHICEWCGDRIDRGEMAYFSKYVADAKIQNDYFHLACLDAMKEHEGNDFEPRSFVRGTIEIRPK